MRRTKVGENRVLTKELIRTVALKCGRSQALIKEILETTEDTIVDYLADGAEVKVNGVGTFFLKDPRTTRVSDPNNPGEILTVEIPTKIWFQISRTYNNKLLDKMKKDKE